MKMNVTYYLSTGDESDQFDMQNIVKSINPDNIIYKT
jgi:hypothetical protein